MAAQRFRARMKRDKYDPETDPEFQDEFGQYFSSNADDPGE